MPYKISCATALNGEVEPPGDKSISHRAVILNSIANGSSEITNYLDGADTLATVECLKTLGIDIKLSFQTVKEQCFGGLNLKLVGNNMVFIAIPGGKMRHTLFYSDVAFGI